MNKAYCIFPNILGFKVGQLEVQLVNFHEYSWKTFGLDFGFSVFEYDRFYCLLGFRLLSRRIKLRVWLHRKGKV